MKLKGYKSAGLIIIALLGMQNAGFAQAAPAIPATPNVSKTGKGDFSLNMDNFSKDLQMNLNDLGKTLAVQLNSIAPKINKALSNVGKDINVEIPEVHLDLSDLDIDLDPKVEMEAPDVVTENNTDNRGQQERSKTYSKTYPLDGNDRVKLTSQFGKITVNTWDRREVKVDVEIRAQAGSDDDAQKLLNGVQINDSKSGDEVSFRTRIDNGNNNNSWNIFSWGGNNKKRKIIVNYTVYMPAKTDLSVEESYGAIVLPDLDGVVRISSSYGSVQVENLSNPSNDIQGSYGSLKAGSINGARLEYSYGSANIEECNNIKADLSYGSFKLGKLKGAADFNISYVGGFKIGEIVNSFKKLSVDASYSGVSVGTPNTNFDFDITTSYGGFNYNDDKVTVTSKNPPDGSKRIGTTRNYKGHVGRGGTDSQVIIRSSYGGVNFE